MDEFTANLLLLLAVLASPAVAVWLAVVVMPLLDRLSAQRSAEGAPINEGDQQ